MLNLHLKSRPPATLWRSSNCPNAHLIAQMPKSDFLSAFDPVSLDAVIRWRLFFLAAIPLAVVYYWRYRKVQPLDIKQYSHFPQPEPADPVRGHWPWIEKAAAEGDPRRAFDEMLYEQAEKLGFPPVLLVDWRPIEKFPILFILDNDVAEHITKPSKVFRNSLPKHPAIQQLAPLVGARSLVTTDVRARIRSDTHGRRANTQSRATSGMPYIRESGLDSSLSICSALSMSSSTRLKPSSSS